MDKAHQQTDAELERMESHLSGIYRKARKQTWKRLDQYAEGLEKKAKEILREVQEAQTMEEARKAKGKYRRLFIVATASPAFRAVADDVAEALYQINQQATAYINSRLPHIYTANYNSMGDRLGQDVDGYDFHPASDQEAEEYADIPLQRMDKRKDTAWNRRNVKAAIIAGASQLLPISKIMPQAAQTVARKNQGTANRHAVNMTTTAENRGRLDSMGRVQDEMDWRNQNGEYTAQSLGFKIKKRWNATKDSRTRPSHRELDGTVLDLDAEFLPGLSQPRDPHGAHDETDGCRCWLTYVLPDISQPTGTMAARRGTVRGTYRMEESFYGTRTEVVPQMTYSEWMEWKKNHGRRDL